MNTIGKLWKIQEAGKVGALKWVKIITILGNHIFLSYVCEGNTLFSQQHFAINRDLAAGNAF